MLSPCAPERTVVGVVGDVRHLALEQRSGNEMYIPLRQCGDLPSADLVVRSTLATAPLVAAVRAALKPLAPNLPGNEFRTIQQLVDQVGLAAALRRADARRLRGVRARPRLARHLRR